MRFRRVRPAVIAATALVTVGAAGAGALAAHAAAVGCRVTYTVTSQWPGGFGTNVEITNLGDPVNGWTLRWSYTAGQTVSQGWDAVVTQSGGSVTAVNVGHNRTIAANGSVRFGFNGSWTNANPSPTTFTFNGTVCNGGVPSPSPSSPEPSSPSPSPSSPQPSPSSPGPSTSPVEPPRFGARQMEDLNRGVISVRSGSGNLVSWRHLGTEAYSVGYNVYRGSAKLNSSPIVDSTNYHDSGAAADASYTVRAVVNGIEQGESESSLRFTGGSYLDVPISAPASGYVANDTSVGDLDGDGQYEIVLKWDPNNAKDNSQSGVTGNVYIDAYRLNGTRLWRIDLGRNIRAGAHYTQFQVYDYDGDGRAEIAMKTADGTRDGAGTVIGSASADYRNSSGYILSGPEFLTMFDGLTGRALSTVDYDPPRGSVSSWGDSYGNRVDRFLAGTAYLDGVRPSLVMTRGYYTRTVVAAWDFRNGSLVKRWTFDSNTAGSAWTGKGNHQLSIADADGDGKDEIMFGSIAIDDDGTGLWQNSTHHGDAYHVGDFIPSRPGLEVFKPSEWTSEVADWIGDARTGQILRSAPSCGCDNGRGVAGDIYAGNPGAEIWSSHGGNLRSATTGTSVGRRPGSYNFLIWWDGDPVRELLDGTRISKYGTGGDTSLLSGSGVSSNNSTKSTPTPALSADLFGDWREEVIWRTSDNRALRIYSTPTPTTTRIHTLMHDSQYRVAIAWQNTAYNQPPHPSFFLGNGMSTPAQPNIYVR